MYSLDQVLKGLRYPRLIGREINLHYHSWRGTESRLGRQNVNPDGIDVLEEDWDNLIILDACRYDTFERHQTFSGGRLEHRISRGCATPAFLEANFANRTIDDTVYVNANPMFEGGEALNAEFFRVIPVWRTDWDEEHRTVLPETVTRHAIDAAREHPDKRLIVHYNQPHHPFIPSDSGYSYHGAGTDATGDTDDVPFWRRKMRGELDVSREQIIEDYEANFRYVLDPVMDLLAELEGKTVVTSDHGNMLGERGFPVPIREWGHWNPLFYEELVKVPWYVVEGGERKEITAGEPSAADTVDEEEVKRKLRDLGYMEEDKL
ncbi:MAG: hypothetical protein ABEI97_02185 [Candidatus Nanohaloarchaea archaeon]